MRLQYCLPTGLVAGVWGCTVVLEAVAGRNFCHWVYRRVGHTHWFVGEVMNWTSVDQAALCAVRLHWMSFVRKRLIEQSDTGVVARPVTGVVWHVLASRILLVNVPLILSIIETELIETQIERLLFIRTLAVFPSHENSHFVWVGHVLLCCVLSSLYSVLCSGFWNQPHLWFLLFAFLCRQLARSLSGTEVLLRS
jgi:hypothetical protein